MMCCKGSGALRHRITVQRQSESTDDYGHPVSTWSDLLAARASIKPLMGREYERASQINANLSHEIEMRYVKTTIKPTDRIKFGERLFEIVKVANVDEMNVWLNLLCIEKI